MDNVYSHRFYALSISADDKVKIVAIVRAADHTDAVKRTVDYFKRLAGYYDYSKSIHANSPAVIESINAQAASVQHDFDNWILSGQTIRIADNG